MITPEEVKSKTIERFWKKIIFDSADKCWNYKGLKKNVYGFFHVGSIANPSPKEIKAHRYIYMKLFGEIPSNVHVLHKCDNRKCVNPNHLFSGSSNDNIQDMVKKGRNKWVVGSNHGMAKLTESDIPVIRERNKNGESYSQIGRSFSVSYKTISDICNRKHWSHVP